MSSLVVSAPGKVIIHGEHAVVYAKPALATSLDLRCYLCLSPREDGLISLNAPDLELKTTWYVKDIAEKLGAGGGDYQARLRVLKELAGIERGDETPSTPAVATLVFLFLLVNIYGTQLESLSGLSVSIVSTLPFGAGLGSSAAYSVCLSAAFLESVARSRTRSNMAEPKDTKSVDDVTLHQQQAPLPTTSASPQPSSSSKEPSDISSLPEKIRRQLEGESGVTLGEVKVQPWSQEGLLDSVNKWGFEAEKLIHGTPSGIDNSISTFGGAMRFQSGDITHLDRIPNVEIMLINTRVPRSTKKMVSGVRTRYDKYPGVIKPILDSIESLVNTAQQLLKDLDSPSSSSDDSYATLQELFSINHHLLNGLGVGHPALDRACAIAQEFGLGAKLTGGGGGGCAIAVIPPGYSQSRITELKEALLLAGFDSWKTVIGTRGVTMFA